MNQEQIIKIIENEIKKLKEDYKQIHENDVKFQWLNFAKREALNKILSKIKEQER